MAYSLPLVGQNVFILKLKLHCSRCESKLKRLLSDVQGIQTVNIDSKQGTVTITGTVEPATILTLLGNLGRKAEVLWEQKPSSTDNNKNLQLITKSNNKKVLAAAINDRDQFNDDVVAQLKQLSTGIKGLKTVDVCYSKTIRLTVNGDGDEMNYDIIGPEEKNLEITIRDGGMHSPQIVSHSGGGLCNGSASCCGGHGNNMHGIRSFCCQNNATAMGHPNLGSYGYGFVPMGPPPPWPGYGPSAPPIGLVYDQPPSASSSSSSSGVDPPPSPATGYSYSSIFSDDNPAGGCRII